MRSLLSYLCIFLAAISFLLLVLRPKTGVLFTLIVKPIIDTAYQQYIGFGFRLTEIVGVGVPVLIIFHSLFNKDKDRLDYLPLKWFWIAYILWNFISSQIMIYVGGTKGFGIFFRVFNGFIGFYMFQRYFREREDFKSLLTALLVAGIFPIGIGVFQLVTGYRWTVWTAEGGIRNIGLYHDQATLKYYFFQTVAAILLYWSYFIDRGKVKKAALAAYFALCVAVLYKLYVKSGNTAFGVWILIWTGLRRKFLLLGSFLLAILLINMLLQNRLFEEIYNVFHKEIGAVSGEMAIEQSFAGRWYGWRAWYDEWQNSNILAKLFGSGETGYGAHNDYLFVLGRSGLIGLFFYLALLLAMTGAILFNMLRGFTPLRVVSLMLIILWLIDAIGLVPSGYPSLQWFVWGFIGLSLRLDREEEDWLVLHPGKSFA